MTRHITLLLLLITSYSFISAQVASPGCYCIEGQLQTIGVGESISTLIARTQYSPLPCPTAVGLPDGTNCEVCACTDAFNDGGFFQIQTKSLFTPVAGSIPLTYNFLDCEDAITTTEDLLLCGPCPTGQMGNTCDAFMAPDPDSGMMPDDAATIPTMGEWSLIILFLCLAIIATIAVSSRQLSTRRV